MTLPPSNVFRSKRAQRSQPSQEAAVPTPESQDNQMSTPTSSQGELRENPSLQEHRAASPTQDLRAPSQTPSQDNLPTLQANEDEQSQNGQQPHSESTQRPVPGPRRSKGIQGWGLQLNRLHTPLPDPSAQGHTPNQQGSPVLPPNPASRVPVAPPPSENKQLNNKLRIMPGPRRSKGREAWGLQMKRLQTSQLDETTQVAGSQPGSQRGGLEQRSPELRGIPGPRRSKGIEAWGIQFRRMQDSQSDQIPPAGHLRPMQIQLSTRPSERQAGSSQPRRENSLPPIQHHEDASLQPIHDTQAWFENAPPSSSMVQYAPTLPVNPKKRHSSEHKDQVRRTPLEKAPVPKEELIIMESRRMKPC